MSWEPFDRDAERYDAWFQAPAGMALFPAEVEAVRRLVERVAPPILEVGVGTGAFARELAIEVGLDPALGALRRARQRGITAVQGVGEALPFADAAFGGVLLVSTFCFVSSPLQVLREARRVLKPGGAVVVGEIPINSPWGRFYLAKKAAGHTFYRAAHFYTLTETLAMIHDAGLAMECCTSTLLQPPTDSPSPEKAYLGILPQASFIAILARKRKA